MGTPDLSSTPLTTALHMVAKPTWPSGMTTSPSFSPARAMATRSDTQKPAAKASFMASRASRKRSAGKRDVLMGTWPVRVRGSKLVW